MRFTVEIDMAGFSADEGDKQAAHTRAALENAAMNSLFNPAGAEIKVGEATE